MPAGGEWRPHPPPRPAPGSGSAGDGRGRRRSQKRHRPMFHSGAKDLTPGRGPATETAPGGDGGPAAGAHRRLPTLQQNALRKIFDRHEFTAEEVARLGQRRLQRAEGIGRKGLLTIVAWLREQGYELLAEVPNARAREAGSSSKDLKKIQKAMRVLRTHGYEVLPAGKPDGGDDRRP